MYRGWCFSLKKFFIDPHTFSIGFRALCWGLPPVDLVGIKNGLNMAACMFWIIVLVKSVAVWVNLLNEWDQGGRQNVSLSCSAHDSLEHH